MKKSNIKWTPISWWKFTGWAGYFTLNRFTKDECIELGEWCSQKDFKDWRFADLTGNFDVMSTVDMRSENTEKIFNEGLRVYFKNKRDATMFRFTWGG